MNELEVFKEKVGLLVPPKADVKAGTITFDLSSYKSALEDISERIKSVGITYDTVDVFKELRAKLNNLTKDVNNEKKRVKTDYNKVYTEFEKQVKECMSISESTSQYVDSQINIVEEQLKQNKREEYEKMWEDFGHDKEIPFIRIEDSRWYLKSYNNKKVMLEMSEINENINRDIELITNSIESEKERENVLKNYYGSLDVAKELGEYTKWKNIVEAEVKVVEVTKPIEEEKPAQAEIKAENEEIKEEERLIKPIEEMPKTKMENVTMNFTAPTAAVDEIVALLRDRYGIYPGDYFIQRD